MEHPGSGPHTTMQSPGLGLEEQRPAPSTPARAEPPGAGNQVRAGTRPMAAGLRLRGGRQQSGGGAVRARGVCPAPRPGPRAPLPALPSAPLSVPARARSLAAQRMRKSGAEGGNRAERNVCGRLSDSDSGGRPDSCQTVPACPLPPFRKGLETSRAAGAPSAPPLPHPFGSKGQRLPGRG